MENPVLVRGAQSAHALRQQGYPDGVRLEFGEPDNQFEVVVELIVLACAIEIFVWLCCKSPVLSPRSGLNVNSPAL